MSYEEIDLDINNYDLKDIISLFKINYDFSKSELKQAKKIVLSMHPDKSKLDKKYFMFFTSAYKLLYSIYEFRYKSTENEYDPSKVYVAEKDIYKEELLKTVNNKHKDSTSFNKWFNELFEKTKLGDEDNDNGYEEWFRSMDDNVEIDHEKRISQQQMNKNIEKKKQDMREIIKHEDLKDISLYNNQYDLMRDKPEYYSSDIFGKLQYNDLKKAHTETVIPVTEEDYINRTKFGGLNDIQSHRDKQDTTPLSLQQSREYLKNKKNNESNIDIDRAYRLAKQDELVKKANNGWWSNLKQLT